MGPLIPGEKLRQAISGATLLGVLALIGCDPAPAPPARPEEIRQAAASSNRLGLDLYAKLAKAPGNLIFSPYGVYQTLAMTSAGASGRTLEEFRRVLHADLPEARMFHALSSLDEQLTTLSGWPKAKSHSTFRSVNGMWVDQDSPIRSRFSITLQAEFRVRPESLALNQGQEAIQQINRWAAGATEGRIPKILDQMPPHARVVLANAVHFKAAWGSEFPAHATKPGSFIHLDGSRTETPLMHQTSQLDFAEAEGCKALAMDFQEGPFRMLFLLPERRQFEAFEGSLTSEKLARILQRLDESHNGQLVKVTLPKFKFDLAAPVEGAVKALGLQSAFLDSADFSRLSKRPLRLGQLVHRAFVAVDEQGAEAAAVTAAIGVELAEDSGKPRIVEFRADHPFLLLIQDRSSGALLFMGRLLTP